MEVTKELVEYIRERKIKKIPVYQRNYEWKKENCSQLLHDVVKVGQSFRRSHFIGLVIIVEEGDYHIVIDGQQRITTFFLMLKAFYDVYQDNDTKRFFEDTLFKYSRQERKLKLQLNKRDNEALQTLFFQDEKYISDELQTSNIYINYKFFKDEIQKLKDESNLDADTIEYGLTKLKVVIFKISQEEEPQYIFEALNSTGIRLRTSDLVKNHIFMRDIQKQDALYNRYWYKLEKLLSSEDIEHLIDIFIKIKWQEDVRSKDIFSKFKEYIEDKTSEAILKQLLKYGQLYSNMLFSKESDGKIRTLIDNIKRTKLTVFYPVILESYVKYKDGLLPYSEFVQMLEFLENYIIRGILIDNLSKGIGSIVIPKLLRNLDSFNKFQQTILKLQARNIVYTSNKKLKDNFVNNIYSKTALDRGKYLLYRIELFKNKEVVNYENLTVEHIYPRKLRKDSNWRTIPPELLHSLGNLTITNYNSEMSNKSFQEKKRYLAKSNISLNREIAQKERWTEVEIREREKQLIEYICQIWPEPDGFNDEVEILDFDLYDFENMDLKSRDIESFTYFGEQYPIDKWNEFYYKVVGLLYIDHKEDFELLRSNGVFEKFILDEGGRSRKEILGSFYLQTSIRPATMLRNITTIFDKLNLNKSELIIRLKGKQN